MTETNIGVFTNPDHDLYVSSIDKPSAEDLTSDEVLIHVRCTGICGSDIHFQKHGNIGPTMVVRDEHILGHESAGEVLAIGSNVIDLKPGDRVALEPGVPCKNCSQCLKGKYNGCEFVQFSSTPPVPGFLRRYIKHPSKFCHKINLLSYEQGALLEPLSVVYSGVRQLNLLLGDSILISGAGPIGFVAAKCAALAGAYPIVVTDIDQSRLDFIKKEIPTITTHLVNNDFESNFSKVSSSGRIKFDIAIDCTGVESSINLLAHALNFGGKLHVIGVGKDYQVFPFMTLSVMEISLSFQYRYANTWPTAIKLYEGQVINLDNMITHRFKLLEAEKAFETAKDPNSRAMKIMIED
ncbi:uncharacterized protein PRCAT00004242001 [Priceomyces carsonii]|uniref:uncharacterized protein n=1 Tax=Priceomyces carsonii TaxID=28549 RepID=UPI002ED9D039|nr:unnamed protein product [Priceomyces carsonii]